MNRFLSRITLTVTDVRVQRVQDITEHDAKAEGVEDPATERYDHDWSICWRCGGTRLYNGLGAGLGVIPDADCYECETYRARFEHLWNYLHAPEAWHFNSWIVALTFTVERRNIDAKVAA